MSMSRIPIRVTPTISAGLLCAALIACGDDGDSAYPGRGLDGGDTPLRPNNSGGRSGGSGAGRGGSSAADGGLDGGVQRDGAVDGAAGVQAGTGGGSGGSGGRAGSGNAGAGSGGRSGSGGASGTVSTDDGIDDPVGCVSCEQQIPPTSAYFGARSDCLDAEGSAMLGPKAGALLSDLCVELLNCMWSSGCYANGNFTDCFCGEGVDSTECLFGDFNDVHGPCKDEFAAAAESIETGPISNRLSDPDYAVGLAYRVVVSDFNSCPFECGFCTPAPGSGPDGDELCHPQEWNTEADAGL